MLPFHSVLLLPSQEPYRPPTPGRAHPPVRTDAAHILSPEPSPASRAARRSGRSAGGAHLAQTRVSAGYAPDSNTPSLLANPLGPIQRTRHAAVKPLVRAGCPPCRPAARRATHRAASRHANPSPHPNPAPPQKPLPASTLCFSFHHTLVWSSRPPSASLASRSGSRSRSRFVPRPLCPAGPGLLSLATPLRPLSRPRLGARTRQHGASGPSQPVQKVEFGLE